MWALTLVVLGAILAGDSHEEEDDGGVGHVAEALVAEHEHDGLAALVAQLLGRIRALIGRAGRDRVPAGEGRPD
jgi:hypothetical protein